MKYAMVYWLILVSAISSGACQRASNNRSDQKKPSTDNFIKANDSKDVIQLAVGMNYSCKLVRSGAVFCWGNGNQGQLGHGNSKSSSVPVRV